MYTWQATIFNVTIFHLHKHDTMHIAPEKEVCVHFCSTYLTHGQNNCVYLLKLYENLRQARRNTALQFLVWSLHCPRSIFHTDIKKWHIFLNINIIPSRGHTVWTWRLSRWIKCKHKWMLRHMIRSLIKRGHES